ncbi:porin [Niastella vici]|uniref:Porin n=1 Tax=Niastella vici TaxID=1703345 RepID=A0A1V9FSX4_9BACT|nr:porin [Niastella vici]OQP61421.1 porin [Niastella vici]
MRSVRSLVFSVLSKVVIVLFFLQITAAAQAQFLNDMIDTTTNIGKGILQLYKKFDRIYFTGYIQPQFQVAERKGIPSFSGGDFGTHVDNRFMLRRGRLRLDYARMNSNNEISLYFVFQFDGTEKGVFIRDFWGRVFENKWQVFSFTAGWMARPFGYEVNLGSADRETPERGRMSQTLMKVERDLGAMVSFEPRRPDHPLRYLKIDAGFYNGQGLNATAEYDSYKDFITRASWKPYPLTKTLFLSGGLSYFNGGLFQNTKYTYEIAKDANGKTFVVDSADDNFGRKAPRKYYGADLQLKWKHSYGATELRAEYWRGTQTGSAGTTETPASLLQEPYYVRKFDGAFIYLLQNIVNSQHQLGIKYDWYDPNTEVKGEEIGKGGNNINATNIKYTTLSVGYNYYINENVRLMLWYDFIKNEKTSLTGYTGDLKDNVFTTRLQFRF